MNSSGVGRGGVPDAPGGHRVKKPGPPPVTEQVSRALVVQAPCWSQASAVRGVAHLEVIEANRANHTASPSDGVSLPARKVLVPILLHPAS